MCKVWLCLASRFDYLLMDSAKQALRTNNRKLIGKIELSNANRFVQDPGQFLDDFLCRNNM
jgi:hypothetical protein